MEQQPSQPQWGQPAWPQPRKGMSTGAKWAIGCAVAAMLAMIAVLIVAAALVASGMGAAGFAPRGEVALIRIEGLITSAPAGVFGGGANSERIVEHLRRAGEDSRIKAVLVRVDSPGGSAAAAQEIYEQIRRVRAEGKPVYVSMGDVAASGGYYVAAGADRIYASPGTVTGSIGVISASLDLSGLFDKIGVEPEVVKSGEFKDMGSGLRPMSDRERELVKGMLDGIHQQFVTAVAEGRKLPQEQVLELADGRIYTGEQAHKLKLVDEIGGMRPALLAVARRAGIKGEPEVTEYQARGLLAFLFGEVKAPEPPRLRGLLYDRMADVLARGAAEIPR